MKMRKMFALCAVVVAVVALNACSTLGGPGISTATQKDLVAESRKSLNELYATTPKAKDAQRHAVAILVFPDIFKAGLIIGGSGGNGVLFSPEGHVLGYYNAASVSYGLQAGAQDFSEAMFLMTKEARAYLDNTNGWSIGAGPSVVVADEGMAKDLSSTTLRSDVYAFIYGQQGLMAGIGIQGQKITRLEALKP